MGATRLETAVKVVLPSAFSGLTAALILAFSRAVGETMIVALAAGNQAQKTLNPLQPARTPPLTAVEVSMGISRHERPTATNSRGGHACCPSSYLFTAATRGPFRRQHRTRTMKTLRVRKFWDALFWRPRTRLRAFESGNSLFCSARSSFAVGKCSSGNSFSISPRAWPNTREFCRPGWAPSSFWWSRLRSPCRWRWPPRFIWRSTVGREFFPKSWRFPYPILPASPQLFLVCSPWDSLFTAFTWGASILTAGLTLSLLVLPVIIVASREAIRAVPQSLREAAFALGATRWQCLWHHVLPASRGRDYYRRDHCLLSCYLAIWRRW